MSRGRRWLLTALLGFGSLALGLTAAELAVRVVSPQPTAISHQDRYGLALHYPRITRFLPQFGHDVSFNSAGMRDRERTLRKQPGTFRILLLGDSFIEAVQVSADSMLATLMERELTAAMGRPVEVINAGVSGWGTDDELRYLTKYGAAYNPDLVVLAVTLHNDISDNLRQEWHTLRNGVLVDRSPPPKSRFEFKILELKAYVATRFQLYQLWRRVRHGNEIRQAGKALSLHVVQLFQTPCPPTIAQGLDLTASLLRAIRDTSHAMGAQFAAILIPLKYQLSDTAFASFVKEARVAQDRMSLYQPQLILRRIVDTLRIPVVDLLPSFREWTTAGKRRLYLDGDGHWTEAGHRLAADQVMKSPVIGNLVPSHR